MTVINNVDILPEIPHEDVWRELKSCTLGVIPFSSTPLSEHNTPTKLFEYMASGCAVVASDVKPIRSWSQNLFPLFQSGDSATLSQIIIDLLDHPEKLDEQRKNNQETIRTVAHWEKIQDRLLSLYQRAL